MKFTLAIISYNAQDHIEQCIESCAKQTYKNLEILVVDDNSSDGTTEIVKRIQRKDSRIRLVTHSDNKSALQARKTAVKHASSEYVWLIDSDDRIDDLGAVGMLMREIEKHNFPDMVCFGSNDYHSNGEFKRVFYDWGRDKPLHEWKIDSDFRPYTRITKKSVLEKAVEVIPDDLYLYRHNDLFMFCLVKLCTSSRVFFEKPLYRYMLSSSSVTNQKDIASISKHIGLIDELLKNYEKVANKINQAEVSISEFVESERKKLIKYAINQYRNNPITYAHALKKIYGLNSNIIISLTTYSKRIQTVDRVIKSLLNQSIAVDKIVLWLDEKEVSKVNLPSQLLALESDRFEVKFCPNYKSYKKLIPTLIEHPESTIITFDDDIEYPVDQVEKLILAHIKNPQAIVTNVARNILVENGKPQPYSKWMHVFEEQVGVPMLNLMPIGVGGVLYPPNSFHKDVTEVDRFMSLAPHGDDIWFKCMALLKGRKVVCTSHGYKLSQYQIEGTDEIGLWKSVNEDTDSNLTQLLAVTESYPELKVLLNSKAFNVVSYSLEKVLDLYGYIEERRKNCGKNTTGALLNEIARKLNDLNLGCQHADKVVESTVWQQCRIESADTLQFKTANRLFLEKKYFDAYIAYYILNKQTPSFKYYQKNMEITKTLMDSVMGRDEFLRKFHDLTKRDKWQTEWVRGIT